MSANTRSPHGENRAAKGGHDLRLYDLAGRLTERDRRICRLLVRPPGAHHRPDRRCRLRLPPHRPEAPGGPTPPRSRRPLPAPGLVGQRSLPLRPRTGRGRRRRRRTGHQRGRARLASRDRHRACRGTASSPTSSAATASSLPSSAPRQLGPAAPSTSGGPPAAAQPPGASSSVPTPTPCGSKTTVACRSASSTTPAARRLTRLAGKLPGYADLAQAAGHPTWVLFVFPSPARETSARRVLSHPEVPVATAVVHPRVAPDGPLWLPVGPAGPRLPLVGLGHPGRHLDQSIVK